MTTGIPPIEYMKSALSVNTFAGCMLGCEYCIVDDVLATREPARISTPKELIDQLQKGKLFRRDTTLLAVNNKTEPFLREVKADTLEILRTMREEGITNPLMLISKLPISPEELREIERYPGQVYFFMSYSAMPKSVEPVSGAQLRGFKTLRGRERVKAIHYWRPLIEGLNDDAGTIQEVLDVAANSCDASVVSGIRLTPSMKEAIEKLGGRLDQWNGDSDHKYLPQSILERIARQRDSDHPGHPLFRKTSCVISALSARPDYNFNFLKPGCDGYFGCDNREICRLREKPSPDEVNSLRADLGIKNDWVYEGDSVRFEGTLSSDQRSFMAFNLGYPVVCNDVRLSVFEEEILCRRD